MSVLRTEGIYHRFVAELHSDQIVEVKDTQIHVTWLGHRLYLLIRDLVR